MKVGDVYIQKDRVPDNKSYPEYICIITEIDHSHIHYKTAFILEDIDARIKESCSHIWDFENNFLEMYEPCRDEYMIKLAKGKSNE